MNRKGFTIIELLVVVIMVVIVGGILFGVSYKFISQKKFEGDVTACESMAPAAVVGTGTGARTAAVYSFAVDMNIAGRDDVLTFSSEDRKFANVVKGDKIKVLVFKYAPWDFERAGTYYGGRLLKKYKQ